MKQRFVLIFMLLSFFSYSQIKEFGIMVGSTHYMGDLTETNIKWKETRLSGGLLFRYYFSPHFNLKANLFYGHLSGADSNKPNTYNPVDNSVTTTWAKFRNLSFKTYLLDVSLMVEYNILPYVVGNAKANWSPYVCLGVSVFSFNPKAKLNGTWYDLQPLGTEGQGTSSPNSEPKYKLTQMAIPYGIGVKYSFKKAVAPKKIDLYLWSIGAEVSTRKTFTDHLDDVGGYYPDYKILMASRGNVDGPIAVALSDRQAEALRRYEPDMESTPKRTSGTVRGNPDRKDQYMFLGITITKAFSTRTCINF